MKRFVLCWTTMAAVCAVLAVSAWAQAVNGTLLGTITDSSGAIVPNARVTATDVNTGISRNTNANPDGNYTFPNLPPGSYSVSAEQTGFKRATRVGLDVVVNTTVRADLMLQPGQVNEVVTVTADAAALQTERADTGRKIETQQIQNLPVTAGRNFQSFIALVPGATAPFRPHSEFFNPQNSLSTQVNGQSRLANNLQFEGIDDNERTGLLQVLIPPLESIQTVDVTTSDYEAELGRATGAVTNVILKSGTNRFHGQAYWFNRVSALSSRSFYSPARSHFVYNYVGGQVSGPIVKNRTFFFGDYLRIMDHRYNGDRYTLPTPQARGGNLSEYGTTIYDPLTGSADGTGRQPFPGNTIPDARIDPISKKILGLVPDPNLSGLTQNYFALIPFTRDTDQFDVKVDHNQTDNDRFSMRYSFERPKTVDQSSFGAAGGPHGGGFQATGTQNTHSAAINYDHIFSGTLIAEARAGVNRYRNEANQIDYGTNDAETLGVPGVNVSPFTSGQVGININGFSSPFIGYSASLPWIRAETNINFVNTWTKTLNNHTLKWGIDVRRIRDDLLQTQTFSPRGRYSYSTSQTSIPGASTSPGNDFASFLLDLPSEVGRDLPIIFPAYRAWEFFSFFQDKWTVTPRLTVDLGLRWELYPPATPAHAGGFSNYDPNSNSLVIAGVGNNPMNLGLPLHHKDFAPRVGIAYRLSDETVVRSGFGISYSPYPDNTYAYNFPVKQNNAYEPNNTYGPAILPNGRTAKLAAGFPAPTPADIPSNGIIPNADINQVYDVVNGNFREPYVESWSLAVQRKLPHNFTLDVSYVGNHGVAQPANYNMNAATVLGADVNGQPLYQKFGRKAGTNLRYVGFSSNYNALQVKIDKRYSSGLAITTAFTYGKAMGFQSEDAGLSYYVGDLSRNWQILNFSRKFNFVQSYVYQLPFGKGRRFLQSGAGSWLAGGWQVNGVLTIASGTPLTFGGTTALLHAPGNSNTLNYFGPGGIQILHGTGRDAAWFDPTICSFGTNNSVTTQCFAQPGAEIPQGQPVPPEFGNLGRSVIYGPGYWNLDASIFRSFRFSERASLELRGEGFSVINTPQWNNPDTGIGNKTFGYITGAGGSRSMQLGAKLIF
jgi:Carboxypeptidase regulatory-like domain